MLTAEGGTQVFSGKNMMDIAEKATVEEIEVELPCFPG